MLCTACSTKKNTSTTRFYHALTARFNTYYNGYEAYKSGLASQRTGHQDNYTELLPMYVARNKTTAGLGKENFETAIEKCEKAIKTHTIKAKPKRNTGKRKTPKQKAYANRKEFNPFLRHAWLLMGKSQFQQGQFIEAAATFNYIAGLYAGQPEVVSPARAWLARCYVESQWPYDAEDVLRKMARDSINREGMREYNASYADYLISIGRYSEAIPYLKKTIKKEHNKLQRARLNFLLGQLYQTTNEKQQAYKAFKRVIKANPPYELAFNARITQTEVMPRGSGNSMIKKLRRMARNRKNTDYQDRIYYAIGNIYLAQKDTARCIGAYEKGAYESTKNSYAKAIVLLNLGRLYWEQENYINAQRCYAELIGILDKENKQYKEIERRANVLTELEPYLSDIKLQDSLQWLAGLSENERNAAIDRAIQALKKQEKEQARKALKTEIAANKKQSNAALASANKNASTAQQTAAWYFYNSTTVAQGKRQFNRTWGKRILEDNWRRSHKMEDRLADFEEYDYSDSQFTDSLLLLQADSIARADSVAAEQQRLQDSLASDPYSREYYMQQIPFSEEQIQASNDILRNALYQAGIIEMEKLQNFNYARKTLLRLLTDFPDVDGKDVIYYYLFLISGRLNNVPDASMYRQKLSDEFPESQYTIMLNNPRYELYARRGKQIEDSLYAATYAAYLTDDYNQVFQNYDISTQDFPQGEHRAKFMFVNAMSLLYTGQRDSFLVSLQAVIEKYPSNEITELAQSIVKGINEGRLLSTDKFLPTDIWSRRTINQETDTTGQSHILSDEKLTKFNFVLAYQENTVNQNQLLYLLAFYNFSNFTARVFNITTQTTEGISQMRVEGFLNFNEAHAYAQKLYADPLISLALDGIRALIISEENLKLIGTYYSYDDYDQFYNQHLAPVPLPENLRLDAPTDIRFRTVDDEDPETENQQYDQEDEYYDDNDSGILF